MGFSIIGLFIAVLIFLPNLLFIIFPPQNVPDGLIAVVLLAIGHLVNSWHTYKLIKLGL